MDKYIEEFYSHPGRRVIQNFYEAEFDLRDPMLVQRMIADLVVRDEQIYELLQEIRVRDKAIDDLRNKLDKLKAKIDRLLS